MSGSSRTGRLATIFATAAAVFALWLAIGDSAQAGLAFFYAVPIGLATWWFGRRHGALVLLACLGLYSVGAAIEPVDEFALSLVTRGVAFVLVLVLAAALRERLSVLEHSAEELETIRAALTPAALPELAGVEAGTAFVPSEHGVSGDFYLLTNGPDSSTIAVVGDVVGHGAEAARLATFIRARLAAFAANTSDPAEILTLANAALVERAGEEEDLVSAVCVRYRAEEEALSCAVAGHPLPLRLPSLAQLEYEGPTMLLGVKEQLAVSKADSGSTPPTGCWSTPTAPPTSARETACSAARAWCSFSLRSATCRRGRWRRKPIARCWSGRTRRSPTTSACWCCGRSPRPPARARARRRASTGPRGRLRGW